jgi:hypothetical protein
MARRGQRGERYPVLLLLYILYILYMLLIWGGCSPISPHENFKAHLNAAIGRRIERAQRNHARHPVVGRASEQRVCWAPLVMYSHMAPTG